MFILISILIYKYFFLMKKTICARNVQTVCNIKLNPWLDISGSRSGFLVPAL